MDVEAPRLTIGLILQQVVSRFFNLERGWLHTVRELTLAPGSMIRNYVRGQRQSYANPFVYSVVGTTANIIVQNLVGFRERMVSTAATNAMDSPAQMEFINRFIELTLQYSLLMAVGVLIPLSLLLRLVFRSRGYNLAEIFVFGLYTVGHLALFGILLVPAQMLMPPSAALQSSVSIAVAAIYTVYAARGFFTGRFAVVVLKTAVAYALAYVAYSISLVIGVVTYMAVVMVPISETEWDLVTAAESGALPVIEKLLDGGADVNMTLGRTALHIAAENGKSAICDLLIGRGADVNRQDFHGRVPMYEALASGQLATARRLAEAGTDATIATSNGTTLLMAALWAEDQDLVRWALDAGADINAVRPGKTEATALMIAANQGSLAMVDLLLTRGADPAQANHEGESAIDRARGKQVEERLQSAKRILE